MNAPLDLEAMISLYNDTVCQNTGQYFCNKRPFSAPRSGNKATILSCGKTVMKNIYEAITQAESFIWIADWQMGFDVELVRRGYKSDHSGQLHRVIEKIISTKPVHVRILLFRSVKDNVPGTFDGLVAERINSLNKAGYPGSVKVALQAPTSAQRDSFDYSHHQKFVVVDGRIGFLGGIDLSYGRWETPEFDVIVDPDKFVSNEMYSPCVIKLRALSEKERKVINKFDFAYPYTDQLIDEGCQPRMPWQDVHVQIEGPSVVDIHRNFVRRWNAHLKSAWMTSAPSDWINRAWLEKVGAWERLQATQPVTSGGAQVQIVRSVSNAHLKAEGNIPDDLQLFCVQRERDAWRTCLRSWSGSHQDNILNAMENCIRSADNYVYIETQFFISKFGTWGPKKANRSGQTFVKTETVDSSKIGNEDDGIRNTIVDALAARIVEHIKAKTPFHVYLVVPTHPEGLLSDEAVLKQHRMALLTIKHGSDSLVNRIKRALTAQQRNSDEWTQFLTVLNMRNYGATVQYARDPVTFNEDFAREIGRFVVTEQIYIHSKLMIVDDAVAIIGSANTNDRSLTGNGDTEIAAVIVDTEDVELRDLGSPTRKVQTRKFARELRQQLWRKHFGFMVESTSASDTKYFRSTDRATRDQYQVSAAIEHPPRLTTSERRMEAVGHVSWHKMLTQPCSVDVVRAIQLIAEKNAAVYESVFFHTPRDSMREFEIIRTAYTLPYPLAFDAAGTRLRNEYLNRPSFLHLDTPEGAQSAERKKKLFQDSLDVAGRDPKYGGVIPPPLRREFMTSRLLTHQRVAIGDSHFGRSQQVYGEGMVHDVQKAIVHLRSNVVGFFVAMPLDWGMGTELGGDISKTKSVDVALLDRGENEWKEA
jgi:phospholipase D1/2